MYQINGYVFYITPEGNIPVKIDDNNGQITSEKMLASTLKDLLDHKLISGYLYLKK